MTAPDLELKATYGLVKPEEFTRPETSPLWTKEVYKLFDLTQKPAETVRYPYCKSIIVSTVFSVLMHCIATRTLCALVGHLY